MRRAWAMLNITHMKHLCVHENGDDLLVVANYTWQQCFSWQLEQEVKITPPGRHVTPTETGLTGNLNSHKVSQHLAGLPFLPWLHVGLLWCSLDMTLAPFRSSFIEHRRENVTLHSLKWLFYSISLNCPQKRSIEIKHIKFSCLNETF